MAVNKLEQFRRDHKSADAPWIVEPTKTNIGGVDPLGLRQINFDLMDKVFPGLNNVARHIRPFTLVTWAWRRTVQLARERNLDLKLSEHQDFVARIEVAYVWSMLVGPKNEWREVDIPGNQRVRDLIGDGKTLVIGGEEWRAFVSARRNSTALTAAINYGPGLRSLRCLEDDMLQAGVRVPARSFVPALDAFEKRIKPILGHKLFNSFESLTLRRSDVAKWQSYWELDAPTKAEQLAFRERLAGDEAEKHRRSGFELLISGAAKGKGKIDEEALRRSMCDDRGAADAALRWKRTQMRQCFRLALEALLEWSILEIGAGSAKTGDLAARFVQRAGHEAVQPAGDWLEAFRPKRSCPVKALEQLQQSLRERAGMERCIAVALSVALSADKELQDGSHRDDRLPIADAARDFDKYRALAPTDLIGLIIERWIIGQHSYWSVGRGLADARSGANPILRLRLALEEAGWTVMRGQGFKSMPNPTPDRLHTAISLAKESGLV